MCGIAGYVSDEHLDGRTMTEVLGHRGPDDTGAYQARLAGRAVYLGHRRLSIIDLSKAGRQPMATVEEQVTIIYNGEVYNFQELKQTYLSAYAFRSKTDTEVLLYLYCELGPDFVKLLNGDFALAILDARTSKLFLYRDRLGVKPLYYYHALRTLVFGSEIKAVLAADVPALLSEESLHKYFVFKYVPGSDTLYRDIKRLRPGCYAEYDLEKDHLAMHQYWSPAPDVAVVPASYSDAKAHLYNLLGDAVRIRLIADVPVGTFLSGGVDSSIIAYFVKEHSEITHYCARKSQRDLRKEGTTSDYDYARLLADTWGLNLKIVDIGEAEATRKRIRQTLYFSDDLIADGSQIPSYLIAHEASKTSSVMLSGMGADELFLGYASHLLVLLSLYFDRLPDALSRRLARLFGQVNQGKGAFKAYRRYLHKFGKYYNHPALRYGAFGIVGDFENSLRVCRFDEEHVVDYLSSYFPASADPFECLTRFEFDNFLVKNLHYFDRMCMANSVEGRVPFLDHRVVEFALSLPRPYRLSAWGKSKRILKDTMRGSLPNAILNRRKAGFGMPLRSIFSDEAKIDKLLDLDFFGGFVFFDVDHIRRIIQSHLSGHEDNSALLYALVSYQEWYTSYFK